MFQVLSGLKSRRTYHQGSFPCSGACRIWDQKIQEKEVTCMCACASSHAAVSSVRRFQGEMWKLRSLLLLSSHPKETEVCDFWSPGGFGYSLLLSQWLVFLEVVTLLSIILVSQSAINSKPVFQIVLLLCGSQDTAALSCIHMHGVLIYVHFACRCGCMHMCLFVCAC